MNAACNIGIPLLVSQVTLESVEIIEIQTFVIGLPVGPAPH